MNSIKTVHLCLYALCFLSMKVFCAGFNIGATRIVYPADAESVTLSPSNNTKDMVFLVAAKVGKDKSGAVEAPFKVIPPLFRIEPGNTNRVKIINTGSNFPKDRESLYYFIASAIPSSSNIDKSNEENNIKGKMSIALRMVIKLFYRPTGLSTTPDKAAASLQFIKNDNGIDIANKSPYYISFSNIVIDGKAVKFMTKQSEMIAPFSQQFYPHNFKSNKVTWSVINDLGGVDNYVGEVK